MQSRNEEKMKKIIVTGCNGQLGRAINQEYEGSHEFRMVNTDVEELDITSIDNVMEFVRDVNPYAIINCAAHTNVDACEEQWDSAYRINAIGPRNLAIAARETGAKIVHVSTDYVFSGDGTRPYVEFDATNPNSAYGTTKLAGEQFVKEFADNYFIIRTAWLYGDGKNFAKTMLRLAETNETVRVVGDQFGTPTSARELARAIKFLVPTENYGLFHGTCEGSCSWAEFAAEIFNMAGLDTVVEAITSAEYNAKANRPSYSVLDNYMLRLTSDYRFADWQDALAEYMKTI